MGGGGAGGGRAGGGRGAGGPPPPQGVMFEDEAHTPGSAKTAAADHFALFIQNLRNPQLDAAVKARVWAALRDTARRYP